MLLSGPDEPCETRPHPLGMTPAQDGAPFLYISGILPRYAYTGGQGIVWSSKMRPSKVILVFPSRLLCLITMARRSLGMGLNAGETRLILLGVKIRMYNYYHDTPSPSFQFFLCELPLSRSRLAALDVLHPSMVLFAEMPPDWHVQVCIKPPMLHIETVSPSLNALMPLKIVL